MPDDGRQRPERGLSGRALAAWLRRIVTWADRKLAPGIRSVLGLLLIVAGFFGLLPILGFWMIPLGGLFIALDIPPLRRTLLSRLRARTKRRNRS